MDFTSGILGQLALLRVGQLRALLSLPTFPDGFELRPRRRVHFVLTANTQSFLSAGSRVYHPEEYLTLSSLSSSILGRVPLILLSGNLIGFSNLPSSGPSRIWSREYVS